MKTIIGITLAVLGFAATIASAQKVRNEYDTRTDFSKFKTYKWVELPGGRKIDDWLATYLTTAIQAGLATKGLVKVDSGNADLYIGYRVAAHEEEKFETYIYGGGVMVLPIGSIALDMYDMVSKQLVWRSTASKAVEPNLKPKQRQQIVDEAVRKLLKAYPPKKK
jgi:hypothetical protein